MATYSYAQLEQLWINAGGSKATAPIAAAIAEAESSGDSGALNLTDNGGTQTSVGLWQVSNGTHQYPSAWLTPSGNAAEAVAKYQGAGNAWTPWGTYDSGAYQAYLSPGTSPDPNVPATATLTSATGAADCLIGPFPHTSWCLLNKSQARALIGGLTLAAGGIVIGVGLALVAVFALNRAGVAQTIVNLTPAGKIAGAAGAAAPAPAPAPRPAPAPKPVPPPPGTPGRKIRTGRGQVSEDFANRYGTA